MQHEITIEDVIEAMPKEVLIAIHFSANKKSKNIKYYPHEHKYRVRFCDGEYQTSNSYFDPLIAISKYNEYHI